MSITFFNDFGDSYIVDGSKIDSNKVLASLPEVYKKAKSSSGTWIVYEEKDCGLTPKCKIVIVPPNQETKLNGVSGSVRLIPVDSSGILLFAHPSYCGKGKVNLIDFQNNIVKRTN